jgi:potassium-transporting ATPase KdpC subunit
MKSMKHVRSAIITTIFWTVVVGGAYPLLMWGIGALFFPQQAEGSLVVLNGATVGSTLIGQDFESDRYFHPRPSAIGYDASNSGASNLGWTSAALKQAYDQRMADWKKANPPAAGTSDSPPMDMLFASGSGLDPHVSPESAEAQVPRVAAARHLSSTQSRALLELVRTYEEGPQLGFMGEPRVNVLGLNVDLDRQFPG